MPGETTEAAAHRRLVEEMGFDCELEHAFGFVYRTDFENGLTEHEYDHVFFGQYEGGFQVNYEEVASTRWITLADFSSTAATLLVCYWITQTISKKRSRTARPTWNW